MQACRRSDPSPHKASSGVRMSALCKGQKAKGDQLHFAALGPSVRITGAAKHVIFGQRGPIVLLRLKVMQTRAVSPAPATTVHAWMGCLFFVRGPSFCRVVAHSCRTWGDFRATYVVEPATELLQEVGQTPTKNSGVANCL